MEEDLIFIDSPTVWDDIGPDTEFSGWLASMRSLDSAIVEIDGRSIRFDRVERPDVKAAFPAMQSIGFAFVYTPTKPKETLFIKVGGLEKYETLVARSATPEKDLALVLSRTWSYEFALPDGSKTRCMLSPSVMPIHTSRSAKLAEVIRQHVGDGSALTALDLACHEGFYSIELARHFAKVRGIDHRQEDVAAARLIARTLGISNVEFHQVDLQAATLQSVEPADFVLIYGLLGHMEYPLQLMRLAAGMARRYILIETQVMPYDLTGRVEDGYYQHQRDVHGVFGLCQDDQGGADGLALIPSLNTLVFLLKHFGFSDVRNIDFDANDYEQFGRRSRVIVYGRK